MVITKLQLQIVPWCGGNKTPVFDGTARGFVTVTGRSYLKKQRSAILSLSEMGATGPVKRTLDRQQKMRLPLSLKPGREGFGRVLEKSWDFFKIFSGVEIAWAFCMRPGRPCGEFLNRDGAFRQAASAFRLPTFSAP